MKRGRIREQKIEMFTSVPSTRDSVIHCDVQQTGFDSVFDGIICYDNKLDGKSSKSVNGSFKNFESLENLVYIFDKLFFLSIDR